jgi:sigma-E factor negative regulatory protein RseC
MSEEIAVVTRSENGKVWIKSLQISACGGCVQQDACATATLAKWLPSREFPVDAGFDLKVGDKVRVCINDSSLLLGSVLLYLLPLLLMLAGAGIADRLLPQATADDWLPEIALSVLLLAFALIHRLQTRLLHLFLLRTRVTGKV